MSRLDPADAFRLLTWCEQSLDGALTPEEAAQLEALLQSNPEARTLFAQALHQHGLLRSDERLVRELAGLEGEGKGTARAASAFTPAPRSRVWKVALTVAAAFALILGVEIHQLTRGASTSSGKEKSVATVVKATQARWAGSTLPTAEGSKVGTGTLELAEGLATLRFESGAEVVLEAPSTLEILDAMNCRLRRGTLVAHVPPSAKGFTVDTPKAKVVDFGTRFGVSTADDGKYTVEVLEGLVEVDHKASNEVKKLHAGQSVDHGLLKAKVAPQASEHEPNRWQPSAILDTGDGWQAISTAYGRGKDSYIQSSDKAHNFGHDPFFRVKRTSIQRDLNRKGYIAFDITRFKDQPITEAELVLTIEPSDLGFASLVPDSTFAVYGLTDETEDDWDENGINWHHAPAHDEHQLERHLPVLSKTVLLGHFEIAQGVNHGTCVLRGSSLAEFLRRDTNGLVTFIICRETDETARTGLVHAFATKESGHNPPPLLRLKTAGN